MLTKKIEKELVLETLAYVAGVILVSAYFFNNSLLTILLLTVWLIGARFWYKKHDIYFFLVGAIAGPAGEIVAINFGAWSYANPSAYGIPLWLPILWGLGVVFIK